MPRDPERLLPTHVLGNRLTDLSTSCGPCSSLWTSSSPSWQWAGAPGEHWLGQLPTEGQESFCGSPGFQQEKFQHSVGEKKKKKREIGVDRKTAWLCLHQPSPKVAQLRAKCDLFGLRFLPQGKGRPSEWAPSFSSFAGCCQRDPFLARRIQSPKSGVPWFREEGDQKTVDKILRKWH